MTSTKTTPAEIQVALAELIALAVAVRRDWTPADVQAAVMDAKMSGLTWPQALVGLVRLLVDPVARPAELVPPKPDPQRPGPRTVADPARHADVLALARADCANAAAKLRSDEGTKP